MKIDDQDLDRSLATLFAEQPAGGNGHFEPDELFAYLAGELSDQEAEGLQDHLEGCRECLDRLLELESLAEPDPPSAEGVTDFELVAAGRAIRQRLSGEAAKDGLRAHPGRLRSWIGGGWTQAAAAVFLVTTLGLSVKVVELQRTTTEQRRGLEQPRINVPVLYADATRAGELAVSELPPGNDFFLLMLMPTETRTFADYEVEISGAGERPIWSGKGLEMSAGGALRLGLSRRFLPPGRYRIRLFGIGAEGREMIEEYPIEIR